MYLFRIFYFCFFAFRIYYGVCIWTYQIYINLDNSNLVKSIINFYSNKCFNCLIRYLNFIFKLIDKINESKLKAYYIKNHIKKSSNTKSKSIQNIRNVLPTNPKIPIKKCPIKPPPTFISGLTNHYFIKSISIIIKRRINNRSNWRNRKVLRLSLFLKKLQSF